MVYLPLPKLLDRYFYAEDIEKMSRDIHEVPTNNKNDNIELLIKEWPRRGHNYYDLIKKISTPQIREICKKYHIDSKGKEKDLIKRIKKAKLLEPDSATVQSSTTLFHMPRNRRDYGIIISLIATTVFFLINPWYSVFVSELLTEECVSGEFDLTIINCEIGLQVSRPNVDWVFLTDQEYFKEKSLNENYSEKYGSDFNRLYYEEFGVEAKQFDEIIKDSYDEYHLGKIIIDNLKNAKITITVHKRDTPYLSDDWEEYWKVKIESKKTNFEDVRGVISISEDRTKARQEMTYLINSLPVKSTTAIEIKGDKAYMVQTLFHDDEIHFENSKEEFNQVLNSIKYF